MTASVESRKQGDPYDESNVEAYIESFLQQQNADHYSESQSFNRVDRLPPLERLEQGHGTIDGSHSRMVPSGASRVTERSDRYTTAADNVSGSTALGLTHERASEQQGVRERQLEPGPDMTPRQAEIYRLRLQRQKAIKVYETNLSEQDILLARNISELDDQIESMIRQLGPLEDEYARDTEAARSWFEQSVKKFARVREDKEEAERATYEEEIAKKEATFKNDYQKIIFNNTNKSELLEALQSKIETFEREKIANTKLIVDGFRLRNRQLETHKKPIIERLKADIEAVKAKKLREQENVRSAKSRAETRRDVELANIDAILNPLLAAEYRSQTFIGRVKTLFQNRNNDSQRKEASSAATKIPVKEKSLSRRGYEVARKKPFEVTLSTAACALIVFMGQDRLFNEEDTKSQAHAPEAVLAMQDDIEQAQENNAGAITLDNGGQPVEINLFNGDGITNDGEELSHGYGNVALTLAMFSSGGSDRFANVVLPLENDSADFTNGLLPMDAENATRIATELGLDYDVNGINSADEDIQVAAQRITEIAYEFSKSDAYQPADPNNQGSVDAAKQKFYHDLYLKWGYEAEASAVMAQLSIDWENGIVESEIADALMNDPNWSQLYAQAQTAMADAENN
jgi:hypothetical protein